MKNIASAIGYKRLSAKDQSKYSLTDQDNAIREYCTKNNLELKAVFTDNGQCSDTFDRADFIALEAFIKKHKGTVRYLVVMVHDRFSRDISEALSKIRSLEQKFKIKVVAIDEPIDIDPEDPDVFIMRAFKYLMANQELLSIRKRTRRGIRSAREAGRHVNMAPFGYKNERDKDGKAILVLVEEKADIIEEIFVKFLKGIPIGQIHKEAKKRGFYRYGNSVIPRILRNSVYAGLIKVKAYNNKAEKYVPALHKGIITEDQFWLTQQMLDNTPQRKSHLSSEFPLRGIVKCWCGNHMTAAWSSGRKKKYLYYWCKQHRSVNVSGTKLHAQFSEILDNLSLSEEQVKFLTESVDKNYKVALESQSKQIILKSKKLNDTELAIEKLEVKMMRDEIEPETYKKWHKKYQIEKSELGTEIQELKNNTVTSWKKLARHLPRLTNIHKIYEEINDEQRFMLIKEVFDFGIIYVNGTCRTPKINPAFIRNSMILKEKGLLYLEQPCNFEEESPTCSEVRDRT